MSFLDFLAKFPIAKAIKFVALVSKAAADGTISTTEARLILNGALDLAITLGDALGVDLKDALEDALKNK